MNKHLDVSVGQFSHSGKKPVNQDFHGVYIPNAPLLTSKGISIAIADGISSSNVSQIASETAVKSFLQDYYCTSDSWSVKKSAQSVLKAINSWLYAQTQSGPARFDKDKGYICTFSAIVFKSHQAHLFHSGDSRIYRLAGNNLEQLTTDHRRTVSAEISYLTHGLGVHKNLKLNYHYHLLNEGDIFVLATDGVYEYLSERFIANAISSNTKNLDELAKYLVEEAYSEGSTDNLTLQIVRIEQLPERNLDEVHQQSSLLPPAPSLRPRMQFEGYDILREIYISSRSHVYLAQDSVTKNKVVLKTPSTEMRDNETYLENFFMEDWIAKRINNAHVLKAIDSKSPKNYRYTITEYLKGKTLAQWMIDNPAPSIDEVRSIVGQIALGLEGFHRQEMVHQDLRPNNIMIDQSGVVKIIDFGATKVAGITEISSNNEGIVGTAQYTAPEYFLGNPGTYQSDLFSLGVITYQMLCGKLPYGNAVSTAITPRQQQRLLYQSLRIINKAVPEWLDLTIKQAVHINPQKRYKDISEFTYDLKRPNANFLNKNKAPLIERNPVLFWQCLSLILFSLLTWQLIK